MWSETESGETKLQMLERELAAEKKRLQAEEDKWVDLAKNLASVYYQAIGAAYPGWSYCSSKERLAWLEVAKITAKGK